MKQALRQHPKEVKYKEEKVGFRTEEAATTLIGASACSIACCSSCLYDLVYWKEILWSLVDWYRISGDIVQRIVYDEMAYPNGITFDEGKQEIFVSDKWKHCVFVFSADGKFLRQLCGKGDREGFLRSPEGIAIGPCGVLFICDTGNDRVQCVNPANGRMLSQFGCIPKDQLLKATQTKTPTRYVDLKSPTGVAIHNDKVIVLDSGNRRVKIFNKQGEKVLEFGQVGTITGQFQHPEVIAVDSSGFILVGDGGNANILIYRPNGSFVTALGCRGEKPGTFNWLSGLYVSKDREIIISDYKNHAVQVIV